ncbi:MAG: two-component regulator propeller domain-containing protein [Dysgonomonas sp.]
MKTLSYTVILLFTALVKIYSQNLFPEKFNDCNIQSFALESKITTARISDQDLLTPLLKDRSLAKVEGTLIMQIYIDEKGKACLVSADNKTNIPTEEFTLNKSVKITRWTGNSSPVCAIVRIIFKNGNAKVQRLGLDNNLGVHEITDKHNPLYDLPKNTRNIKTSNNPQIMRDEKTNSIWSLYTFENSMLPYNLCRSAETDSKGNIWIGTDRGIVKINNDKWTVLDANNSGLEANQMGNTVTWDLAVDKNDRLWTLTMGKNKIYDGVNWTTVDKTNSPIKRSGDIIVQDSAVWIVGFDGFYEYTDKKWTEYNVNNSGLSSNTTRDVYRDKYGNLWIATDKGISLFDGKKWKTYNSKNSKMPADGGRIITGDKNGNIWIGISTEKPDNIGGVVKITPENKWIIYTIKNSKLPSPNINDIKFEGDKDEIVWICTGKYLVRIENDDWEIYDNSNSFIPNNYVSSITFDHNGNKWIATYAETVN